jgi:glycosyltransferase involved in cell wall biosynthesis
LELAVSHIQPKVTFLGNVQAEDMPALMNCVDVLVLPSMNEGLPLVCAEALKCGARVVGSDVGGIAEVIGQQNVVSLGSDFTQQFAQKVVSMLADQDDGSFSQILPSEISWEKTTARELSFLK